MKTKPTHTVKLCTVQSGIEAELREIIKTNLGNKCVKTNLGNKCGRSELLLQLHDGGVTAVVPMFSDPKYRQGLRDALKVVRAQFESYH